MALFTVDLECWYHAVVPMQFWESCQYQECVFEYFIKSSDFLRYILNKYEVKACFYVLGPILENYPEIVKDLRKEGHKIQSHGYFHSRKELARDPSDLKCRKLITTMFPNRSSGDIEFRSPYWDTTPMPWPPSGGFFFRAMPYAYVKWAVEKSGVFWVHPHDLDENHTKVINSWLHWKRHINFKVAKVKLERLLSEVTWDDPHNQSASNRKSA